MDILREFLESSTIHGITYISTARVSFQELIFNFIVILLDQVGKDSLVLDYLFWVHNSWNPYWQVI